MAQYELSLYDYWRIIKRRKFVIFFSFTAVMISTWIFTNMQVQIYQSSVTVKIEPSLIIPGVATEALGWDILTAINTEVKIIKSTLVAERAARKLKLIKDITPESEKNSITSKIQSAISAERVGDTNLVRITATSSLPEETAQFANATAEVYIEKGIEDRSRRARELREFVEKQMADAEGNLKKAEDKLRKFVEDTGATGVGGHLAMKLVELQGRQSEMLKKYTDKHPDVVQVKRQIETVEEQMKHLPKEELEHARLSRDVKLNDELYTLLAKRHKEAQISEADRVQSAFIVTPAFIPSTPIKPSRTTNFTIGALLGIFIGFVFALVLEHLDVSIGTIEEVETFLSLPVVGVIPRIERHKRKNVFEDLSFLKTIGVPSLKTDVNDLRSKLIVYHSVKSPFVESYHTLRTNIKFAREDHFQPGLPGTVLMFTSTGVGEGKTLTAVNFAMAAAQTGMRTLFVELDLRRPAIHKIFGINRIPGFTECIMGKRRLNEITRGTTDFLLGKLELGRLLSTPGLENIKIVNCGTIPPNPVDVLNSPYLSTIIDEMRRHYELIIFDTPPVLLFADALIISKYIDSVILIYRVGRIARGALKRAKEQLVSAKAKILGIVLNDIRAAEMEPRYGYYYDAYKY
ncbi:MAG: polysaccharide biosynthesis tyrosine autokinase, partial [Elusimicrobiota bacterium]